MSKCRFHPFEQVSSDDRVPAPIDRQCKTLSMATYGVRLAKAGDADRLYEIHRLAMRALVERVYGPWEDAVQRPMHDEWMRTSEVQVIESEGEVVGALHVRWEGDHAYLGRIELAPTAQGQGLGTSILVDLLARAATRQLEVRLEVWEINPAVRLYRRLGFICDRTDGHKIHMSRGLAEGSGAE